MPQLKDVARFTVHKEPKINRVYLNDLDYLDRSALV